jgi:hypothetical protein
MNRNIETFRTNWNGIEIEIRWEPNWLNLTSCGYDTAHLEIETIAPERAPLPITDTGYRSHFISPETVAAYGGPVSFIEAWLETESQAPDWRRVQQERQQLTLF